MKRLLIWGAGDQGTVTAECALAMNRYEEIGFLTIREKESREIPGYTIYEEKEEHLERILRSYDEVIAATGSNDLREAKLKRLETMGIPIASIIHPTAVISPSAAVSKGCTVLAGAVIHTNARIGTGCIVNTGAIVEHDCIVDDFVNICPRVSMAGHTEIGRKAYLGIGCTIIDAIRVGNEAVVGAGAVVIRDVMSGTVVAGVPARPLNR